MPKRWTAEDVARNPWQREAPPLEERSPGTRRRPPQVRAPRRLWPRAEPLAHGWQLIYHGKLPRMNVESPDWRKRWNFKQACLRQFGILPQPATRFAHVTITRILGPRERLLDHGNLVYACKGLEDSLTNRAIVVINGKSKVRGGGNYIIDDAPRYAQFTHLQDQTRRGEGPAIEITITYQEPPS